MHRDMVRQTRVAKWKKFNRNSRGRGRQHRRGHPNGDRRTRRVRNNNMLYAFMPIHGGDRTPVSPPAPRPNWWLIIYYVFIRISVTRARPRGELPPPPRVESCWPSSPSRRFDTARNYTYTVKRSKMSENKIKSRLSMPSFSSYLAAAVTYIPSSQ